MTRNIYIISKDELTHYGVRGMKWGVRKQQPTSMGGRFHRLAAANYNLNAKFWGKTGNKALSSMNKAAANNSLKKAQASDARKVASINSKRQKVKAYSTAYDKASSSQDKADAKWREAQSIHKGLGKTAFGRAREVAKASKGRGSSAAQEYLKKYGEWEALQGKADKATKEMRKAREDIGANWVSRTFRTIKYR